MTEKSRDALRRKRHARIRLTLAGTTERPRLSVFRSSKHIYAQVVGSAAESWDLPTLWARRSPSARRLPA